jgi:hypothetical protein
MMWMMCGGCAAYTMHKPDNTATSLMLKG